MLIVLEDPLQFRKMSLDYQVKKYTRKFYPILKFAFPGRLFLE